MPTRPYPLLLLLFLPALLLATLAALATWLLLPDPYESTGTLDIKPYFKRITFPTEQSMVMPIYNAYVDNQIAVMQSPSCLKAAIDSPTFQSALAHAKVSRSPADFAHSLWITHEKPGELVTIRFVDTNPAIAQVAVQSLMDSYLKQVKQADETDQQQGQFLEKLIAASVETIKTNQERINQMTIGYETPDIMPVIDIRASLTATRDLATFKLRITHSQEILDQAKQQLEHVNLESLIGARTTIVSNGTSPTQPLHRRNFRIISAFTATTVLLSLASTAFTLLVRRPKATPHHAI